jgi:Glyoxalase/Bleomycin resistance protein/Dioxygenase superfamily
MENSKASNMPAYPRAVNHVGVGVADIERAIRWYQEVLGFTLLMGPIEVRATDPGSNVHDVLGQDRNAYGIPHGPGKAKPPARSFDGGSRVLRLRRLRRGLPKLFRHAFCGCQGFTSRTAASRAGGTEQTNGSENG